LEVPEADATNQTATYIKVAMASVLATLQEEIRDEASLPPSHEVHSKEKSEADFGRFAL
jgi:hypothetical protein